MKQGMEESYIEGLATHGGPESCDVTREGRGEALTGVRTGQVVSRESNSAGRRRRMPRRKATSQAAVTRAAREPGAVRDPVHVRKLHAREAGEPTPARPAGSPGGPLREG